MSSNNSSSWSSRQKRAPTKERFFIFTGRAYPQVKAGKNSTTRLSSTAGDREAFYRDPAVVLSDENLDAFAGTEGAPLCVEHNRSDVVGLVHHTWLGDGDKRALKIMGRIPLGTPDQPNVRGQEVAASMRAGRFKGLSVGYGTGLRRDGNTGITELNSKMFREISLVEEPFFEDCHLAWGVEASKEGTKNSNYYSTDDQQYFYVPIEMSQETAPSPSTTTTTAPTLPATPKGQAAVPAEELLRQADQLKEQNADLATQADKMKARLDFLEAKERAEAESYAKEQMPKYEAYVESLAASRGAPLSQRELDGYQKTFCKTEFREAARTLEAKHLADKALQTELAELRASKVEFEKKLAAADEEKRAIEATMNKTSSVLTQGRAAYAQALKTEEVAAGRKDVGGRQLNLNEIMCPTPSAAELPFLQAYGYSADVNVNASAYEPYGGTRQFVASVQAAAPNRLARDDEGNLNFPASARNIPGCSAFFAWMCNNEELRSGDLSDVVHLNASRNIIQRKDADEIDAKSRTGGL